MASVVESITKLNITGNVIPNAWWTRITMQNGKPDCNAVVLLSEIVYWYRAKIVRDEASGCTISSEKRFKSDKLQRSYQSLADQFGFTKRQVQEAMYRLRDAGLITLELRTVNIGTGMPVSNVLFIEPNPEKIEQITYATDAVDANGNGDSCDSASGELSRYNVRPSHVSTCTPITPERETYTEITTEITTETESKSVRADAPPTAEQKLSSSPHHGTGEHKKQTATKGTRLPDDWTLPDQWRTFAIGLGLSPQAITREADIFADYWRSIPGAKAVKLDWFATWRNWIRKIATQPVNQDHRRRASPPDSVSRPRAFGE